MTITKFSVYRVIRMGSNATRFERRDFHVWSSQNGTWRFGVRDPRDFHREWSLKFAGMEQAVLDLSHLFIKIFIWATITAVMTELMRLTFRWFRNLHRQRKETRERQEPEAETPTTSPQRYLGPTSL